MIFVVIEAPRYARVFLALYWLAFRFHIRNLDQGSCGPLGKNLQIGLGASCSILGLWMFSTKLCEKKAARCWGLNLPICFFHVPDLAIILYTSNVPTCTCLGFYVGDLGFSAVLSYDSRGLMLMACCK